MNLFGENHLLTATAMNVCMNILFGQARKEIYILLDEAAETHEPIQITGKGAYSRRINIQYRMVYQVYKDKKVFKLIRMWIHYE